MERDEVELLVQSKDSLNVSLTTLAINKTLAFLGQRVLELHYQADVDLPQVSHETLKALERKLMTSTIKFSNPNFLYVIMICVK